MIVFFSVWVCSFSLHAKQLLQQLLTDKNEKKCSYGEHSAMLQPFPNKSSVKNNFNWVRWAPEHLQPTQQLPPSFLQVWTPVQPRVKHLWAQLCRNFHSEYPALIKEEHYYIPYSNFSTLSDFSESLMNTPGQEFSKSQLRIHPCSHSTWLW